MFATVLPIDLADPSPYAIDETYVHIPLEPTLEPMRPAVSVPSVKAKAGDVKDTRADTGSTRADTGSHTASHTAKGKASYYCCTKGYSSGAHVGAACSKLRDAMGPSWRGRTVVVSGGGQQVAVKLVDWCGSKDKLIDLHPGAFTEIGPLWRGVLRVTVRW